MNITAGTYSGRKIIAPNEKVTRPTLSKIRMGVFNTLYSLLGDFSGKSFLDVFGGSGIMGLEAVSRGFTDVKVYEQNRKSAEIIRKNYISLGLEPNLIIGDSLKLILNEDKIYDVIYIDPPYQSQLYEKIIPSIKGGIIVVESSFKFDIENCEIIKQKKYGNTYITYAAKSVL